jgi:hypothetical protein
MAVAFRQPTFRNPLPALFKGIGKFLAGALAVCITVTESAGRARAAHQLHLLGYHEEAKQLMLRQD